MKILIIGGAGMLGHRLWLKLSARFETWATARSAAITAYPQFDRSRLFCPVEVTQFFDLVNVFASIKPDCAINCVGLIKQRPEANNMLAALELNAVFPHRLAQLCAVAGARLIHISTDCVFSGARGNYIESDPSDASDIYGKTKYLGEVAYPHTITLRTSIIGRELEAKFGLVEWFLAQSGPIRGFRRAIYSGLTTDELSHVIADYVIPYPELNGLYHVSSTPISKYDLLRLVGRTYGRATEILSDDEFVCDRSLNSDRFRQITGYAPPAWPDMIRAIAQESDLYER